MCGTQKELVGQIYKDWEGSKFSKPMVIHCMTQQRFFVKNTSILLNHLSTVNFIRQFRDLLLQIEL